MNDLLIIYTKPALEYARQLKEMSRSSFPVAIRTSLNSAAYDVKKNTLQRSADAHFVKRSANFFKANSRVVQAQGFDIRTMEATVGMVESSLKLGGNNYAVKDLESQEFGGNINRKSFIPLNTSRSGKSNNKSVALKNRLSSINRIVDARKAKGVNDKQKFVKSVLHAGAGGYVLSKWKDKMILWRVNSLYRTADGKFKLTPLYSYEEARSVSVKATGFMRTAANESAKKIPDFFVLEAKKQIAKLTGVNV